MKKIVLLAELIIIAFQGYSQEEQPVGKATFEYEAHANGVMNVKTKDITPLLYGLWYLGREGSQIGLWGFSYFEPGSFENSIGPRISFINTDETQLEGGAGIGYDLITQITAITSYAWFENQKYEGYVYHEFGKDNYTWNQFFLQRKFSSRLQFGIAYQTSVGYGLKLTYKSKNEWFQYYVHPAYENNEYKVLVGIMINH